MTSDPILPLAEAQDIAAAAAAAGTSHTPTVAQESAADDFHTPTTWQKVTEEFAEELGAEEPTEAPSLGGRLASKRTLFSLLFAFSLLGFFLYRQGVATLVDSWAQIRAANPVLLLAALGAYYLAFPVRSRRWQQLLANSGEPAERIPAVKDLAEIIYLSWFANSIVPAKLGDIYRGWLLRRTAGVKWSHAMGTIVAERVLDVIVLVCLVIVTGLLTYGDVLHQALVGGPLSCLESGVHLEAISCTLLQLFVIGGIVAATLVIGLLVFSRFGGHVERFLPARLAHVYQTFAGALILSFGQFPWLLGLSLLAWLAEGTAFWFVGLALGYHLPIPLVIFFSLLQAFVTTIPLTPGGLGFESVLAGALGLKGFPAGTALALTLTYRAISYLSLVLGGAVVYTFSKKTK